MIDTQAIQNRGTAAHAGALPVHRVIACTSSGTRRHGPGVTGHTLLTAIREAVPGRVPGLPR